MTPVSTRFLDQTYPDIASNVALDEALLLDADENPAGPILRIWEPRGLAVVLGASGRMRDDVEVERCRADGVEIGRRSSGGGTVVVGPGTVNVTIILRTDEQPEYENVDTAQIAVLETVAAALREAGRDVRVDGSGDLTLDGRKFSGSAQRRLRHWFMIHATILNTSPIEPIIRYTRQPAKQPTYRGDRSHDAFLTRLDLPRATLIEALRTAWQVSATSMSSPIISDEKIREMVQSRFGDPAWIERL